MISFKGRHFPKPAASMSGIRFRTAIRKRSWLSGVSLWIMPHPTGGLSGISPLFALEARRRKATTLRSWRMDGTYVEVRGKWASLYRAVDKAGKTLDFMLSKHRNEKAATLFFAKALASNGLPEKIVIDKSGATTAGIGGVNKILNRFGCLTQISTIRPKYPNNIIEHPSRRLLCNHLPVMGPSLHHEKDQADAGVQVIQVCGSHTGWD